MGPASLRRAKPEDASELGALHVASWDETYSGILPDAMLADLSVASRTARWAKILGDGTSSANTVVWLAEDQGRVVGFGSAGRQRDPGLEAKGFDAEISAIYVLRSHQRAGLGRALMAAMALTLRERAHCAASLWVLRENEIARKFYDRLGGIVVAEKEDVRPLATLVEVAYGWKNLSSLET